MATGTTGTGSVLDDALPPTNELVIWRYIQDDPDADADWFNPLLDSEQAFKDWSFTRPALPPDTQKVVNYGRETLGSMWFGRPVAYAGTDPNEGTLKGLNASPEEYCRFMAWMRGYDQPTADAKRAAFLAQDPEEKLRYIVAIGRHLGVSCWHRNADESPHMWSDFVPGGRGVAIRSTVQSFDTAISSVALSANRKANRRWGTINYVDLGDTFVRYDGPADLLRYLDPGWWREQEVRCIAVSPQFVSRYSRCQVLPPVEELEQLDHDSPKGFNLNIDLRELIHEIRVQPKSDAAYLALVRDRIEAKGLDPSIVRPSTV